jgi:hypothetical protein
VTYQVYATALGNAAPVGNIYTGAPEIGENSRKQIYVGVGNYITVTGSDYTAQEIGGQTSAQAGTGNFVENLTPPTPPEPPFVNPTLDIGAAVSVVALSPFAGGGNSYQFASSVSSYIDTPGSADWAPGTGDFTIEWFGNQSTLDGFQRVFTVDDFASIDIGVSIESGTFYYWANDAFRYSSSSAATSNTWTHWAVVRASGVTRVYRNGTQLGSQITDNNNITNTVDPLSIGNENTASLIAAYVGLITNFRWIKGLAVYTGNFTVPTSALTATAAANPYGGSNTAAIPDGVTKLLLVP